MYCLNVVSLCLGEIYSFVVIGVDLDYLVILLILIALLEPRTHCDKVCRPNDSRQAAARSARQSASCGIGSEPPAGPGASI